MIELHGEINGFAEAALNDAYVKATDQQVETLRKQLEQARADLKTTNETLLKRQAELELAQGLIVHPGILDFLKTYLGHQIELGRLRASRRAGISTEKQDG